MKSVRYFFDLNFFRFTYHLSIGFLILFVLLIFPSFANNLEDNITGTWRVMSMRTDYKSGFSETIVRTNTMRVTINSDHAWKFSSSQGTWSISDIKPSDWKEWGISSYGTAKKIILKNWNKKTATGPIEISNNDDIDAIWIVYPYISPTKGPGTVQMKLGAKY